ncbi:hypothetical protein ACS0TY_002594 [Phlomoides rotata]
MMVPTTFFFDIQITCCKLQLLILLIVYNHHLQLSFPEDNLRENVGTFVNALLLAKPAGLKKRNSGGRGSRFDEKSRKVPNFDQH